MRIFIVLLMFVFCISCNKKDKLIVWEKIQKEVRIKNIDYLLNISKDTLSCIECNKGKSKIIKEDFFKYYFIFLSIFSICWRLFLFN